MLINDFYIYDVRTVNKSNGSEERFESSGGHGALGVMNAYGNSIGSAFAKVYKKVSELSVTNLQYRVDLTEQFLEDFRKLHRILTGEDEGWIGVDLDGTLAKYGGWSEDIGEPIPLMVQRVKRWIREGKEVRILTARGSVGGSEKYVQLMKVYDWIEDNIGSPLEVTSKKDPKMLRLYDDRVVKVEANEGVLV